MRKLLFISCLMAVAAAVAERQPYERYKTIVDRQMFGAPPAGFDPAKMPSEVAKVKSKAEQELTQEQEKVKKAIKFSVLNVTPDGETVVGFTDSADPKNPLHYYLKVGESQNGWTVKAADREEATMTIEKGDIEVTLKLGGDSTSDAAAVSRTGGAGGSARPGAPGASLLSRGSSLRERRRQQLQADAAKREEAAKAREEAERAREEAEKAREEAEKAREADREEQRKQLQQIQEELRKAREVREAAKASEPPPAGAVE